MKEKFSAQSITEVTSQPTEIQGIDSLQQLGTQLFHPGVGAAASLGER
jgi:hypothetical protein